MKTRLVGLLAAWAAAIIVVAGCGSSGDSSATTVSAEVTTSDLTKPQFVKQANAICAKNSKELNAQFQAFLKEHDIPGDRLPTEAELGEAVDVVVAPVIGGQIEEIRSLGAPAGEEKQVEKILESAEEAIEKSEKEPLLLLNDKGSSFDEANKLSREYGLQACSE